MGIFTQNLILSEDGTAAKNMKKKLNRIKIILRILSVILLIIAYILTFLICAVSTVFKGPSETMKNLAVSSFMETSALKFIPRAYFSEDEINEIIYGNTEKYDAYIASLSDVEIQIPAKDSNDKADSGTDGITVEDVFGDTYCGKMMIIDDPSRVSVAVIDNFDINGSGMLLSDISAEEDVTAAFNGGGFADVNGAGGGGMPRGVVIKDGVILSEAVSNYPTVIGFDSDHKLIVGNMTAAQAINLGVVEAVSFGPVLVKNSVLAPIYGSGGGLNPRTAIGQREDGAILVLAIDGRQPHSLGATYTDIAEIMLDYGAVNAANLDGGSSTMLFYNGEMINSLGSAVGERRIPTAFIVK